MEAEIEQMYHGIPEQRLVAAVVVTAMRDACIKPFKPFGEKHFKMTFDCMTAHDFLWTEALESYLHYLDVEVGYFRKALLKTMDDDTEKKIGSFKPEDRRAFRFNKRLWDAEQSGGLVKPLADPESDEWKSVDPSFEQKLQRSTKFVGRNSNTGQTNVAVHQNPEGV
jgi:hypothetical protein